MCNSKNNIPKIEIRFSNYKNRKTQDETEEVTAEVPESKNRQQAACKTFTE